MKDFLSFVHVLYWQEENVSGNGIGVVLLPSAGHLYWFTKNVFDANIRFLYFLKTLKN